jgi:hypothetical protein
MTGQSVLGTKAEEKLSPVRSFKVAGTAWVPLLQDAFVMYVELNG